MTCSSLLLIVIEVMQPTRVLIVEDERIIVLDLTDRLTRFGCEVIGSCASADEAIALARKQQPDLVLMDVMLSGERDGIEAATELKQELSIPVVFLTAFSDDRVLERAKQAEPYGFIIKPFKERELYSVIELATYKAQMEKRLRSHERLLDSILSTIGEAVISVDTEHRIRFANPAAADLLGTSIDETTGSEIDDVLHTFDEMNDAQVQLLPGLNAPGGSYLIDNVYVTGAHGSQVLVSGSVSPVKEAEGRTTGYTIALRDVSDLRRMTDTISYQVTHDSLTRLLNRDEFITRMAKEMSTQRAFADGKAPFYLYADIDNFKVVNDVCGHAAGDELLRQVAEDMMGHFVEHHLQARIGDDEFGIFIPEASPEYAEQQAYSFHGLISRKFEWRGHSFPLTASVAVVPVATENADPFSVLAAADDACYMLKDRGGNGVQSYRRGDTAFLKRRGDMHWTSLLSRAIDEERFVLFYQPIVSLHTGETEHREILMRLIDEEGGIITPGHFIPAAETYNLMPAIDRLILEKVLHYLSNPPEEDSYVYCVNLSAYSLADRGLVNEIKSLLKKYSVAPQRLCLEITETAAIENFNTTVSLIERLRELGCTFALDDFGNGFSSFAYLKNLPADIIKIDGSFVQHVADSATDRAMVEAINSIAHVLGMKTIAEFVKDETIRDTLRAMDVDLAQGFLIARPQPLDPTFVEAAHATGQR